MTSPELPSEDAESGVVTDRLTGPAPAFMPAVPEPPATPPTAPVAKAGKGTSDVLTAVLVGAIVIAAVGVAFAVGRASSPTSGSGGQPAAGVVPGGQGMAPGDGNGQGGPLAGRGPDASFDLDGGGTDGDPDRGFGFDRGFGRGFGPGGVTGTVTAVDADSITVRLASGQTVTFGLDGSTAYHQQVAASASDVQVGGTVEIGVGEGFRPDRITQGDDGSITLGTAGDVTVVP